MRTRPRLSAPAVLLGLAAAVVAQSQDASTEYRVGPKDLLEIRVFEIPELNLDRRVTDSGAIELPMLGDFSVGGLTAPEVAARLEAMLTAKYLNRANVSVVVKEYSNKPVSILGAVPKPGSLNISGNWYLLQAIAAAGGLTETAGRSIYVLRKVDNGLSDTLEIQKEDLFRGSASKWNIPIFPSDVVNVQPRTKVRIICIGEVKAPGAVDFESDDRITLLAAIAKVGGLTDRASSTIRIKRRGAGGKDAELIVDFKRVLSGKDPDPELRAEDVVVVKESFF